jgi:hypothetical protein
LCRVREAWRANGERIAGQGGVAMLWRFGAKASAGLALLVVCCGTAKRMAAQTLVAGLEPGDVAAWTIRGDEAGEAPGAPIKLVRLGSLAGTVMDGSEAAVPGAVITLAADGATEEWNAGFRVESGADGSFVLQGVPAGVYRVRVDRDGFQSWTGTARFGSGQRVELGEIALTIAATDAVEVSASARDVAEAQMQLEEKQRVLGVFPNFYASYVHDAAPLSAGEKFRLAWRFSGDPAVFMVAGITAMSEQRAGTFPGYGRGAAGYTRRFSAAYADGLSSTLLGQALLPALFHQDPRYFVKGEGSVSSRTLYALASTVMCKGDSGHWQVNYSNILGNLGSAGMSNAYYPSASRGVGLVVQNGLTATALGAVGGLFQEFLLHRMTPHVPDYGDVR